MTDAERILWTQLRRKQLLGHRFRRQAPIGPYVVDFLCVESRLAIEVDGSQHADSISDQRRDLLLRSKGYRVLRFWNHDVMNRIEEVLVAIATELHITSPLPASGHLPPQAGEGS